MKEIEVVSYGNRKALYQFEWHGSSYFFQKGRIIYVYDCLNPECKKEFATERKNQKCCSEHCKGKLNGLKRVNGGYIVPCEKAGTKRNEEMIDKATNLRMKSSTNSRITSS
jgi:hypothetical protein